MDLLNAHPREGTKLPQARSLNGNFKIFWSKFALYLFGGLRKRPLSYKIGIQPARPNWIRKSGTVLLENAEQCFLKMRKCFLKMRNSASWKCGTVLLEIRKSASWLHLCFLCSLTWELPGWCSCSPHRQSETSSGSSGCQAHLKSTYCTVRPFIISS